MNGAVTSGLEETRQLRNAHLQTQQVISQRCLQLHVAAYSLPNPHRSGLADDVWALPGLQLSLPGEHLHIPVWV